MRSYIWAEKRWPMLTAIYTIVMMVSTIISIVFKDYGQLIMNIWLILVQYRSIVLLHKMDLEALYLKLKMPYD